VKHDLPVMLERMSGMLVRFLDTVQVAHVRFLDEGAFEHWGEPTTRGTRRLAGIDLQKARNRSVVDAVVGLATEPDGITLAQWAETVRQRAGWSADVYSTRHAAYDLAKLRGKNLVRRRTRSRRYEAEPRGVRTMCTYLILRDQVIKPLLAGVVRPPGRPPRTSAPWISITPRSARNSNAPFPEKRRHRRRISAAVVPQGRCVGPGRWTGHALRPGTFESSHPPSAPRGKTMKTRRLQTVVPAVASSDGAGVKRRRRATGAQSAPPPRSVPDAG
jgi:hypothetical protein